MAAGDSVDRFRGFLRDHGLPVTPQRLAIATAVLGTPHLKSADDVVAELATMSPAPGTATVYRTLELLVSSGLVIPRDLGHGSRQYEPVAESGSALRLLCETCGAVEELEASAIIASATALAAARAFAVSRVLVTVHGTCDACQRRSVTTVAVPFAQTA